MISLRLVTLRKMASYLGNVARPIREYGPRDDSLPHYLPQRNYLSLTTVIHHLNGPFPRTPNLPNSYIHIYLLINGHVRGCNEISVMWHIYTYIYMCIHICIYTYIDIRHMKLISLQPLTCPFISIYFIPLCLSLS